MLEAIRENQVVDYRNPKYSNVKFLSDEGREVLKVQNGWAKEMIDRVWICDNSVSAAPPNTLAPTSRPTRVLS